ncbi:hypothetical protein RN01_30405 [Cupriavidus sp. SHE]|jgi:hypothetical protein|uniref:Uncharacterized protein n=1 Tax=Cupriavidus metallidurans TaxID=119219 RepID=A0A2L0X3F8_9BURK|nr:MULTISPECIES: hypothetical protein [Cupriavidus]AVA34654.1 hypothetical protein C3Z06_14215 [Cupriavidus metallidurans]KWR74521.1 hypothetical protein RN01_30405 [Cupriavidus sp. SHE]QBP12298.1 hypothetical protein DDF84_021340 [Cupriavidus metallidurans]
MTPLPTTAAGLLDAIERAGVADEWTVSTDPADPLDLCQKLRRTFRMVSLADAPCAVVVEFGGLFVVCGGADMPLSNLDKPDAVVGLLQSVRDDGRAHRFVHALRELLFDNAAPAA